MKLHLLDTAGYHANDVRQTACFMIPEQGIVLDAGTGFYRLRDLLETTTLDIFLTHAHLDHVIGLTHWFDIAHERQIDRATIHALPDKLSAIQTHLLDEHLFPAAMPYEYRPLVQAAPLAGGGRLTYFPVVHPGGAVGFRLDWPGHSLAYVTDTTASLAAEYAKHIQGVGLLLHECTFRDGQEDLAQLTGHSCTSAVAQLARRAAVGQLVFVHMYPLATEPDPVDLEAARKIFTNTSVGHDGQVVEF